MHCWARYLFVVVVIALGTLSMLGACGQKGPLVLPGPDPQPAPATGTAQPTDVPIPAARTQPPAPNRAADMLAWPAGNN